MAHPKAPAQYVNSRPLLFSGASQQKLNNMFRRTVTVGTKLKAKEKITRRFSLFLKQKKLKKSVYFSQSKIDFMSFYL